MDVWLSRFVPFLVLKTVEICILQVLVLGQHGEEVSLELILRVVADVGLVVSFDSTFN